MDNTRERAFTLIELLVVCGVMVIVTSLILTSNSQYGGKALLQGFTYDVALSIRQAQVYGIAVRGYATTSMPTNYGIAYGVHFDSANAFNQRYTLFADVNGSGKYEAGTGEDVTLFNIGRGYRISKLCVPADDVACTTGSAARFLDILFVRPESDAWISWKMASLPYNICIPQNCASPQPSARIVLLSPRGDKMSVSVYASGQITVDQTPTP